MSNYPYGIDEHYPDDALHAEYLSTYNTRIHGGGTTGVESVSATVATWWRAAAAAVKGAVAGLSPAPRTTLATADRAPSVVAGWSRVIAPPGKHYSVNSDQLIVKSLGLSRTPITYTAASAWEAVGTSAAPAPGTGSVVSAGRLASLTSIDAAYLTTGLAATDRAWNWQVVKFDLSTAGRNRVSELRVLWQGYGEPTTGYATKVMLYNRISGAWETVVSKTAAGSPFSAAVAKTAVPSTTCLSCHDGTSPTGVVVPSGVTNVGASWLTAAFHGPVAVGPGNGGDAFIAQYATGRAPAIPCTTCHDPHGTSSLYHVPTAVADKTGVSMTSSTQGANLCSACHTGNANDWHSACTACHFQGYYEKAAVKHFNHGTYEWGGTDCLSCHGHGKTWVHAANDPTYYNENGCHCGVPGPYNTF
jgi:hypothetical protein